MGENEEFNPSTPLKDDQFMYIDGVHPMDELNSIVPWPVRMGSLDNLSSVMNSEEFAGDEICLSGLCISVTPPQLVFFRVKIPDFLKNIDMRVGNPSGKEDWGSLDEIFN